MRVIADSSSLILRATSIVVFTVSELQEGPWEPGPRRSQIQEIRITAMMGETLKGPVVATPGSSVRISGRRSMPGPRDSSGTGVWSSVDLSSGVRLVALSVATSSATGSVFAESSLVGVFPARGYEDEIRRVSAIERSGEVVAKWIDGVVEPPALSCLFGHYVVARLEEGTLYRDPAAFDKVMEWLKDVKRGSGLQSCMIDTLTAKLLASEPNPPGFTEGLARAVWEILGSTTDESLAEQIESNYLPNLLGLEGAAPMRTPQVVFRDDDRAKARLREVLLRRPATPDRDRLIQWISL